MKLYVRQKDIELSEIKKITSEKYELRCDDYMKTFHQKKNHVSTRYPKRNEKLPRIIY